MKKSIKFINIALVFVLFVCSFTILSACGDKDNAPDKCPCYTFVSKEEVYRFTDETNIMNLPNGIVYGLLNNKESGIIIRPDGTITVKIILRDIKSLLELANIDLSTILNDVDLDDFVDLYVSGLFPGFSFDNVKDSLALLPKSTGIGLVGLDFESENIKKLVKALETKPRSIPKDFIVPEGLGIEYNGKYFIKNVTSADGTVMKGVFIGDNHSSDTDPYVIMTMYEQAKKDGSIMQMIKTRIEFVQISMFAEKEA
ncbi:MAG: hypothetical protein RR357_03900 [Clostridia bacterium]